MYDTFRNAQDHPSSCFESLDLLIRDSETGYAPQIIATYPNVLVVTRKNPFDPCFLLRVRSRLKRGKYDIIHSHSMTLGLYMWLAKIGLGIKLVYTIHGFWDARSPEGKLTLKRYFSTLAMTYIANATVCVSKYVKTQAQRSFLNTRRIRVVWNGVDFQRTRLNPSAKADPGNKRSGVIFGMLGAFNHGRDYRCVLDAVSMVSKEYKDISTVLAGDGPLLDETKRYASLINVEKNVSFVGNVGDVADFLASLDCYIYSSMSDTFGISVIEAMASGLPTIVSDNGPFPEITSAGEYACLFRAHDPQALANRMMEFIRRPKTYQEQATKGRNYAIGKFSIQSHMRALSTLYSDILNGQFKKVEREAVTNR